jgi:glycosyltransferase involved in cell wall biosynthesis
VPDPLRVAYTLEQCWHPVPGGSAIAALEVARRLFDRPDVELVGLAGRHARPPQPPFVPGVPVRTVPIARPWLYETWNRFGWPKVEAATGPVDVCHSTVAVPAATGAPHVVTVHDVAFLHAPERFSKHGVRVMRRGLERARSVELVLCPSRTTADDLVALGFDAGRLRVVPWGVEPEVVAPALVERVRQDHDLPTSFVLFVGTLEPRKNLPRLAAAAADLGVDLVVAGAPGWGDVEVPADADVRFLGFIADHELRALMTAADVLAYPSLEEGFGLPILEAMAQGTPVVTSRGTATEEVAGGAAVLVDPFDVASIAAGLERALADRGHWSVRGVARAAACSWDATVDATVDVYRELAG